MRHARRARSPRLGRDPSAHVTVMGFPPQSHGLLDESNRLAPFPTLVQRAIATRQDRLQKGPHAIAPASGPPSAKSIWGFSKEVMTNEPSALLATTLNTQGDGCRRGAPGGLLRADSCRPVRPRSRVWDEDGALRTRSGSRKVIGATSLHRRKSQRGRGPARKPAGHV